MATIVRRGPTVAGVPLRVSPAFFVGAILMGLHFARDVGYTELVTFPAMPAGSDELGAWLQNYDSLNGKVTHPSIGWAVATGLGVVFVYFLSVLAHELGHLAAARAVRVDVVAVELDYAGGFVEMHDDDRLTAGRLASIAGAGPLVTALLALAAFAALRVLGGRDPETAAGVTAMSVLMSVFVINVGALALNLLPFRSLDGGQLVSAARLRLARG